jgi:DNA invertase Pin-like site-specific DNA recombinase
MTGFLAYFRVSTDKQGIRGLGMAAQETAVTQFLQRHDGVLIASYIEVESGRKVDRPELLAALAHAKKERAVLVIAKLDRLARNVAFISQLLESGVELVCCDMPQANRLTLHILAAVAEHEREMISQRTKAALAAAKARGVKLGTPNPNPINARSGRSRKTAAFMDMMRPIAAVLEGQGHSRRAIARLLNERGYKTYAGREWKVQQVSNLLNAERYPSPRSDADHVPTTAI